MYIALPPLLGGTGVGWPIEVRILSYTWIHPLLCIWHLRIDIPQSGDKHGDLVLTSLKNLVGILLNSVAQSVAFPDESPGSYLHFGCTGLRLYRFLPLGPSSVPNFLARRDGPHSIYHLRTD